MPMVCRRRDRRGEAGSGSVNQTPNVATLTVALNPPMCAGRIPANALTGQAGYHKLPTQHCYCRSGPF
jgi:hypothetical protein